MGGNSFTFFVSPHLVGGTQTRSSWGVPKPGPAGGGTPTGGTPMGRGYPDRGKYPTSGTPPLDLNGGYPDGGTPPRVLPHWTWMGGTLTGGTPMGEGGTPMGGTPPQVNCPPHQTWMGGGATPMRLTDGVLDKWRSVCLLHSRRRTFLFKL